MTEIEREDTIILRAMEVHDKDQLQPGKMYMKLFHGRDTVDEDMEDWGYEGPWLGPIVNFHNTYLLSPQLEDEQGHVALLTVAADLIAYGGKYYGDFSLIVAQPRRVDAGRGSGYTALQAA